MNNNMRYHEEFVEYINTHINPRCNEEGCTSKVNITYQTIFNFQTNSEIVMYNFTCNECGKIFRGIDLFPNNGYRWIDFE